MVCPNIADSDERLIPVSWNTDSAKLPTVILIHTSQKENILVDIISLAANNDIGVQKVINHNTNNMGSIELTVVVKNKEHLLKFINALKMNTNIIEVERLIK